MIGTDIYVCTGNLLIVDKYILTFSYFNSRTEKDRQLVKDIIREIRWREKESDDLEKTILIRLCADESVAPRTFFLTCKLVETTGDIADHLENSSDMMRAMIAR